ncbi:MAG TPA: hypothetical protein VGA85_05940 [Dehalococcoidales bacterium]
MGCGSWCVYYKDRNKSVAMCRYCPDYDKNSTPRKNLAEADIFKLADGLYTTKKIEKPVAPKKGSKSETCPRCGLPTLMYNEVAKKFECINPYCPNRKPNLSQDLTDYFSHSHDD